MAATNRSIDFDALLTMTADNYYKNGVIQDAVFNSNPTVKTFRNNKFRYEAVGGGKIQVNLMYGKNDAIDSYSRYETLNVAPQDGFTPAFYDWAQYSGPVSIDGLSEFQNMGKPQIQKLLREKVEQLTMSFAERLNSDLWDIANISATGTMGNSGKNINSIPLMIQDDPTDGMDVGGIDQSAETWWANVSDDSAGTTFVGIDQDIRHTANNCTKGTGGGPDLYITDQETFETYEAGMDTKTRYTSKENASIGFANINFKDGEMFWDINVPDSYTGVNGTGAALTKGSMYMINSKYMNLCIGKGKDFAPLGFQRPANQDARTGLWVFYGQLICSNRRKQGVLAAIDRSVVA